MPGDIAPKLPGLKNANSISTPLALSQGGTGTANSDTATVTISDTSSISVSSASALNLSNTGISLIGATDSQLTLSATNIHADFLTTNIVQLTNASSVQHKLIFPTSMSGSAAVATFPAGTYTVGSVTSVGYTGDGTIFNSSVTGSPVTTSGTFVPALKTQTANTVLAGPISGSAATPTFRAINRADYQTVLTWTPVVSGLTVTGGTVSYTSTVIQTGQVVVVSLAVVASAGATTTSTFGVTSFSNLPVANVNTWTVQVINSGAGTAIGTGILNGAGTIFTPNWTVTGTVILTFYYLTS